MHTHLLGALSMEDMLQGCEAGALFLVVHHGVAVAEGAALHVLPAQPHVVACAGAGINAGMEGGGGFGEGVF